MSAAARRRFGRDAVEEGRSAADRAARRHHGRQADGRDHSALSSAAAVARRRGAAADGRAATRISRARRHGRPHRRRDGSARRRRGRRAHAVRHAQGRRSRHGDRAGAPAREARRTQRSTIAGADGTYRVRVVVAVHDPPVWTIPPARGRAHRARAARRSTSSTRASRRSGARASPRPTCSSRPGISADEVAIATRAEVDSQHGGRRRRAAAAGQVVDERRRRHELARRAQRGRSPSTRSRWCWRCGGSLHVAAARQAAREWAQVELAAGAVPPLAETDACSSSGSGSIGARVAALAAGLGMRVIGVRAPARSLPTPPGVRAVVGPDRLREVLPQADVVVLALPRTRRRRARSSARAEFAVMKPVGGPRQRRARPARSTRPRWSRRSTAAGSRAPASMRFSRSRCRPIIRSGDCRTC